MPEPESLDSLLTEGAKALAAGDRQQALIHFYSATRLDPKSVQAWLGLARSTDNRDDAINALGQAVALDPNNVEARNLRVQLQVKNLSEAVSDTVVTYRENPIIRVGRPLLLLLVVALLAAGAWYLKDPVLQWWEARMTVAAVVPATPTTAVLPATWTPVPTERPTFTPIPTDTPVPSPTPNVVKGLINGTVSARTGPGTVFPVVATLNEPTAVQLTAINPDGKYYQVRADTGANPVWVSAAFVTITSGNVKILPVLDVPTPVPTRKPPTPKPVVRVRTSTPVPPAPPPPPPAYAYRQSKFIRNPFGPRCDQTYIHGTVWNYASQEPNGGIQGVLVRVWVSGAIVATDSTGTHGLGNVTPGYWQVVFSQGQAASGVVAIIDGNGQLLSQQYGFSFSGGDCSNGQNTNEIIMDFERIH